jgi:hypothetical protein
MYLGLITKLWERIEWLLGWLAFYIMLHALLEIFLLVRVNSPIALTFPTSLNPKVLGRLAKSKKVP